MQVPLPKWQDLAPCTQWILIDFQWRQVKSIDPSQGLSEVFRSLHLRLRDIVAFADMYLLDKHLWEQWDARIRATDPSQNDLAFYQCNNVWTKLDLKAYNASVDDINQGIEYLRSVGGDGANSLVSYAGCRRTFCAIPGMDQLDIAFLKKAAQRGVEIEYGDLTRKTIDWLTDDSRKHPAGEEDGIQVVDVRQPREPGSLRQDAQSTGLDDIALDIVDAPCGLKWGPPFDGALLLPYLIEKPGNSFRFVSGFQPPLATLLQKAPRAAGVDHLGNQDLWPKYRNVGQQASSGRDLSKTVKNNMKHLSILLPNEKIWDSEWEVEDQSGRGFQAIADVALLPASANLVKQAQATSLHEQCETKTFRESAAISVMFDGSAHPKERRTASFRELQHGTGSPPPRVALNGGWGVTLHGFSSVPALQTLRDIYPRWYPGLDEPSTPTSDCSYERHVREYEQELQDSIQANGNSFHYEYHRFASNRESWDPARDLRFDIDWYASQQPIVHKFPRKHVLGWDDRPEWYRMPISPFRVEQARESASVGPGQPRPNLLVDPLLMSKVERALIPGQLPPAQSHGHTAQANNYNLGTAPTVGSATKNATAHSRIPESNKLTPAQTLVQAHRSNMAIANLAPIPSSEFNESASLSLVETSDGQVVLQQEPVREKNNSLGPSFCVPRKRVLDDLEGDDENQPIVEATPACRRRRAQVKETVCLDSDENFDALDVPICEADDGDWEPEGKEHSKKRAYVRKGNNINVGPAKKRKVSGEAAQKKKKKKKKTIEAAPEADKTAKVPKAKKSDGNPKEGKAAAAPKRKYTKRKKVDACVAAVPAVAGSSSASPLPMLSGSPVAQFGMGSNANHLCVPAHWIPTTIPEFALKNLGFSGHSPGLPPADAEAESIHSTLPVSGSHKAPADKLANASKIPHLINAAGGIGETQATDLDVPHKKPKRKYTRRASKNQGQEAEAKPKRVKIKREGAVATKDIAVPATPPIEWKETPILLPFMPGFPPGRCRPKSLSSNVIG